jgi:hypothetical protein
MSLFFIPAVLYMIDNNIWYGVMAIINPSTFQLMSNIKIVFVAVLCRFALHKVLASQTKPMQRDSFQCRYFPSVLLFLLLNVSHPIYNLLCALASVSLFHLVLIHLITMSFVDAVPVAIIDSLDLLTFADDDPGAVVCARVVGCWVGCKRA